MPTCLFLFFQLYKNPAYLGIDLNFPGKYIEVNDFSGKDTEVLLAKQFIITVYRVFAIYTYEEKAYYFGLLIL